MVRQRRPDLHPAGDDLDDPEVEEGREDGSQDRLELFGDGVELEHHDPLLGVQLVEHVQRGDGEDVAGAEHERTAAGGRGIALGKTGRLTYLVLGHTGCSQTEAE